MWRCTAKAKGLLVKGAKELYIVTVTVALLVVQTENVAIVINSLF